MSKQELITARKGNRLKTFTLLNWKSMPANKYGWSLEKGDVKVPTPPEAMQEPVKPAQEDAPDIARADNLPPKVNLLPKKPVRPKKK